MLTDQPTGLNLAPAAHILCDRKRRRKKKKNQSSCSLSALPAQLNAKWANKILEPFMSVRKLDNVITPDGDMLRLKLYDGPSRRKSFN